MNARSDKPRTSITRRGAGLFEKMTPLSSTLFAQTVLTFCVGNAGADPSQKGPGPFTVTWEREVRKDDNEGGRFEGFGNGFRETGTNPKNFSVY